MSIISNPACSVRVPRPAGAVAVHATPPRPGIELLQGPDEEQIPGAGGQGPPTWRYKNRGWDARLGHTDARHGWRDARLGNTDVCHGWRDLPGPGGGVFSSLNTGSSTLSPIVFSSFLVLFLVS